MVASGGVTSGYPGLLALAGMSETLSAALWDYLVLVCLLIAGLALVLFLVRRRLPGQSAMKPFSRLAADDRGAAFSADFILVAVPVLVFITLLVQITWMMRETIVVHYAAYSAARSAKSHECPLLPAGPNALYLVQQEWLCSRNSDAPEQAARYALITASPPWDIPCLGSCAIPDTVLRTIARQSGISERANMLNRQARYAFDQSNVRLSVEHDHALMLLAGQTVATPGARPAVKAELIFRNYLFKWTGRLLGERRGDGLYYKETRAVVRLL